MRSLGPGLSLRLHLGEAERAAGGSAATAVVQCARDAGLAGATVRRGTLGFGAHRRIHVADLIEVEGDLPLCIEVIDTPRRIAGFLPLALPLAVGGRADIGEVRRHHLGPAAQGRVGDGMLGAPVATPAGATGMEGTPAQRLCVYCGEADRFEGREVATAIVEAPRRDILGRGHGVARDPGTRGGKPAPGAAALSTVPGPAADGGGRGQAGTHRRLPAPDRLQGGLVTLEETRILSPAAGPGPRQGHG